MARLSEDVRARLRLFAFLLVNGTLQVEGLPWVDYRMVLLEPSMVEQVFAIWSNVLEVNSDGRAWNDHAASQRAAQYIRGQADRSYVIDPPLEQWEIELYL
jgi:hypothetical protein